MKLDSDAALAITQAQNLLAGVKKIFPAAKPVDGSELLKMGQEEVVNYSVWLLGTKIPRLARSERVVEAQHKLSLAQGLVLGCGAMNRHDVHLCTMSPPAGSQTPRGTHPRKGKFCFTSLTV